MEENGVKDQTVVDKGNPIIPATKPSAEPVAETRDDDPIEVLEFKQKWRLLGKMRVKRLAIMLVILSAVVVSMYFFFLHVLDINIFAGLTGGASGRDTDIGQIGVSLMFIFIAIYILQALTLNLIPGTTTVFIAGFAYFALFQEDFLITFMVASIALLITSQILYFYGRYAGRRVLFWTFGREKLEKKLDWVAKHGTKAVPWMFLIPFMPNDLLVITCGASKMKYWQFTLMTIVFKPIEAAVLLSYSVFLTSDFLASLSALEIIIIVNLLVINTFLLVLYHRALLRLFNRTVAEPLTGRSSYRRGIAMARLAAKERERELRELERQGLLVFKDGCDDCAPDTADYGIQDPGVLPLEQLVRDQEPEETAVKPKERKIRLRKPKE